MSLDKDYLKDLFTDEVKGCLEGDFSGSYNDLSDKPTIPTIPTNVSAFTNDAGYLTEHQDISGKADKATTLAGYGITDGATKSDVSQLSEEIADQYAKKSAIPTKVSQLTNDSGYLMEHQDVSGKEDKSNKVASLSAESTDLQYPSAKCVYDMIGNVEALLAAL